MGQAEGRSLKGHWDLRSESAGSAWPSPPRLGLGSLPDLLQVVADMWLEGSGTLHLHLGVKERQLFSPGSSNPSEVLCLSAASQTRDSLRVNQPAGAGVVGPLTILTQQLS